MNNKRVVRITESDLRDMIEESVSNILNELDWSTYASAAEKRDAQIGQMGRDAVDKGGNRLTKLRDDLDAAASNALTRKYAQKGRNGGYPKNNANVYTNNGKQVITTNNFDGKGKWSRGEFNYDGKGMVDKQGYNLDSEMDKDVEDYMSNKGWIRR